MGQLSLEAIIANARPRSIAGFAVVAGATGGSDAAGMVRAFIGPYGDRVVNGQEDGLAWSAYPPGVDQVLSTWSHYTDSRGSCLLEGEFYSSAWEHRPRIGQDNVLARLVLEHLLARGSVAVDELNGLFSGAVYDRRTRQIWLFVDRLGCRFLYYRALGPRLEAATNLYGFRAAASPPTLDAQALNEHLVLGSPTDSRTLFAGIRLVPPGTVVKWSADFGVRGERYYRLPARLGRQSEIDGAAMVSAALDRHMGALPLARRPTIALSAGKDSRVVLATLLRAGIRPVAITFHASREAQNVLWLCAALGLEVHRRSDRGETMAFDLETALLQDGYSAGTGFLALAAQAGLHSDVLFTGFSGDVLSGGWAGVQPSRLASVEALALKVYLANAERNLSCLLRPDLRVPEDDVMAAWATSFRHEDDGDLVTTYLRHRMSHRNRRRIAPVFSLMRAGCSIVQPFADRRVLDAYLSLPLSSLRAQGVHRLVAMAGPSALGQVPVNATRLPFRYDTAARLWLDRARAIGRSVRGLRQRFSPSAPPTPRQQRFLAMATDSGLFDPGALATMPFGAVKAGATAMHVAWMLGQELPSAPTPSGLIRDGIVPACRTESRIQSGAISRPIG